MGSCIISSSVGSALSPASVTAVLRHAILLAVVPAGALKQDGVFSRTSLAFPVIFKA